MYKKHKGFTLIELLAVIIILSIVALIATSIILDVVEDARISAGKSESNMIYNGINNYCASIQMKKQLGTLDSSDVDCTIKTTFTTEELSKMVNLGNATVDKVTYDGNKLTELIITSNNHKFILCPSGTFTMDDEKCDGEVAQSGNLISTLLGQYKEGETTGLVKDSTNENIYYYTGTNEEVANNFLWYGGHQWRVLEFDTSANTLTLITQQPLTAIYAGNGNLGVWLTEEEYNNSYINQWLNDYFWNSLDSSIQSNIKDNIFNIGVYTDVDNITTIKKVGLLDEDQYIRAGNKDSFLDIKDYWYLGTKYLPSSGMRIVTESGSCYYSDLFFTSPPSYGVRAVIKISDLAIVGGDGTLVSNYQVANKATNTDNVQVGEYINVPYIGDDNACGDDNLCTFRVVSKDSDSIKVVLNGLISELSQYGNGPSISVDFTIYQLLNTFARGINEIYRYTDNKIFYVGEYLISSSSSDYKVVQNEELQATIGLPTIGEMFSGNDIDLGSTKTFVDISTIENPNISDYFWTMNRLVNYPHLINTSGYLDDRNFYANYGVRPVIYLKSGLTFTGGEGTPNSPYTLQ